MNYIHAKCPTITQGEQDVAIPVKHLEHAIFLRVIYWDDIREEYRSDKHVAWILDVVPGAFIPYLLNGEGKWRLRK